MYKNCFKTTPHILVISLYLDLENFVFSLVYVIVHEKITIC